MTSLLVTLTDKHNEQDVIENASAHDVYNDIQNYKQIFYDFGSEFKSLQFFKKIGVYIEPTDIIVGSHYCAERKKSKSMRVHKEITILYILQIFMSLTIILVTLCMTY